MTERLYYEDAHMRTFTARVASCVPGKHGFDVVLDRTCFYPEGGGQAGDTGLLGGVRVTDTHERDGEVVHYCESPLEVGAEVAGEIDWDARFERMQLHSGEHILSGLAHKHFGYENVGFHMGADFVTIDFNGMLDDAQLAMLEREANEAVWQDLPVEVTYPSPEELKTIPYRSKKELTGQVRIVTIPGYDICACCGTHVSRTGEIGPIRIFSCVKFHDGVRLEILCGRRAYEYVPPQEGQLLFEDRMIAVLPKSHPLARRAEISLKDLAGEPFLMLDEGKFSVVRRAFEKEGLTPDGVRRLADAVMQGRSGRAAVFAGTDAGGYAYAIGQVSGDLRGLTRELNACLNGRGGGKPGFVQGNVRAKRAEIEAFWREKA